MAIYRGKLTDTNRRVSGVQVVAYLANGGDKVDTDVTDKYGFYQFNNLAPGAYDLYFFGGGYQKSEYVTIFISDQDSNTQYFITPTAGTVLKNNAGELGVQLYELFDGKQSLVVEGPVELCVKVNGQYQLLSSLAGVNAPNEYSANILAEAVDGTLVVYAVAEKGTKDEFVYDSITFADLTDGVGFIGWVEPSTYVVNRNADQNLSPEVVTLTPHFAIDGVEIDLANDTNFQFTGLPTTDAVNGVAVNMDTGIVTVTSEDYFDEESQLTAS